MFEISDVGTGREPAKQKRSDNFTANAPNTITNIYY